MKITQHTPGPFRIFKRDDLIITIQCAPSPDNNMIICVGSNKEANAALVLAAPELLAALEKLVEDWALIGTPLPANDPARIVIAKAKGQQ